MASSNLLVFLALVMVLLPMTAHGNFPDRFYEKICDDVQCGKGNCTANENFPYGFKCECQPGWKRTREDDDDDDLSFLPCVIPNCTLNYSCQPAPPPVPAKKNPHNFSFFDPCYWAYCGEGTCTDNRTYAHRCECNSGYYNLLNVSVFPCYSDCTIGSDCSSLGVKVAKTTTGSDSATAQATSFLPGKFHWMAIFLASLGMALWK